MVLFRQEDGGEIGVHDSCKGVGALSRDGTFFSGAGILRDQLIVGHTEIDRALGAGGVIYSQISKAAAPLDHVVYGTAINGDLSTYLRAVTIFLKAKRLAHRGMAIRVFVGNAQAVGIA